MASTSKDKGKAVSSSSTTDSDNDAFTPRLSFSSALSSLERSSSSSLSSSLTDFFVSHLPQLRSPHNPFPKDPASRKQLLLKSSGDSEAKAAEEISDRFELDELEALRALRAVREGIKGGGDKLNEDEWDGVTAFVFEIRAAVVGCVGFLLRCQDDPSHPCQALAAKLLPDIITTSFPSTVLTSFVNRTTSPLPDTVRASPTHSRFWAKQLLLEQKALLEILFLVFYSRVPPDGPILCELLKTVEKTKWGQKQEMFGYFDVEATGLVREIGDLLSIIVVEALNLEAVMRTDGEPLIPLPTDKPLSPTSIFHPTQLTAINDLVVQLVQSDSVRSSHLLLGWAFILSRVTTALIERGVPPSYHTFATQTLRVDSGTSSQPIFQLYAAHALSSSSSLFPSLLSLLSSPLLSSPTSSIDLLSQSQTQEDPNAVGYISVLSALISSLPLFIKLSFLPSEQFTQLSKAFEKLYSNPSASQLSSQLWDALSSSNLDEDSEELLEEKAIVELAITRFPVQYGNLVGILRGLGDGSLHSPSSDNDEYNGGGGNRATSHSCVNFLTSLPTLTYEVPPTSPLTPLPYELIGYPELAYKSTRPIRVSKRITVPTGTKGRLASAQGVKPVVISWEIEWSGWKLAADVLEDYAGFNRTGGGGGDVFGGGDHVVDLPVRWETEAEHEDDVEATLGLFRFVFVGDPAVARVLVEHIGGETHFVEVLFGVLEKSLRREKGLPGNLISTTLGLIRSLLPSFPGVIWTALRGSTSLFPSSSNSTSTNSMNMWTQDTSKQSILSTEKLAGTYPITLSIISLVHALVLEEQVSSYAISNVFAKIKHGVLVRALAWVRDEVWSACGSWRFGHLGEKYQLARKLVLIFGLVLEEAELPTTVKSPISTFVTDTLLDKSTVSLLTPLLSTFASGPEPIVLLRKALRFTDAQSSEDLVESTFFLLRRLLRIRRQEASPSPQPSLLEKLCLSYHAPEGLNTSFSSQPRTELLASIARFIVAPIAPRASIQAAQALTMLCLASGNWQPRPPSLTALLGGSEWVHGFVESILQILSDPMADEELQVAIWDLISAIIETQPSLAILFVTGRHYPFAEDPKSPTSNDTALTVGAALAPPSVSRRMARTAIGVGLEIVGTWNDAWAAQPALLTAVLRFFDFAWQHLVDYGSALDSYRNRPELWKNIVDIAFKVPSVEPKTDEEVQAYCHRVKAKSHAVRILALDIQATLAQPPKSETPASSSAVLQAFANGQLFARAITDAIATSCSPDLHAGIFSLIAETFPEVPIEALRLPPPSHPLDECRQFGSGYLYSLPMFRRKLDAFMSDSESMIDPETLADVVDRMAELNLNFSVIEAQISNTRAWLQLLEIALPVVRRDETASLTVSRVAADVACEIADETRSGQSMTIRHRERLSILLTLVEVVQGVSPVKVENYLVELVSQVSRIFVSETLLPLESVAGRLAPPFHRILFRIAYFVLRKLNTCNSIGQGKAKDEQAIELRTAIDLILRSMVTGTQDLLLEARIKNDADIEQDVALAVAVLAQLIRSIFVPKPSVWLGYCRNVNLFRSSVEVFVFMEQLDGRVLYAQAVLDLILVMASSSSEVAEYMAIEGLMTALTNNALTAAAEAGRIKPTGSNGSRTQEHALWTTMLALVVSLTSSLGASTQFVEQEVTGFVRLYSAQLAAAMSWNAETPLTLPGLEEIQNTAALVYGVFRNPGVTSAVSSVLAEHALFLLQHVVFAILHPNHLTALIEPVTPEERSAMEMETSSSETDLARRPIVGSVTLALIQLARVLVDSLVSYTEAFTTLTRESLEWRTDRAIVIPSATVASNEKASVGTLFDLASFCLDKVREPLPALAAPGTTPVLSSGSTLTPYTAELFTQNAQQTLEGALLLAASQLAVWLCRPEPNPSRSTLAMRREIQTELAGDLLSVVDRTGHVGKTDKKKSVRFQGENPGPADTLLLVLHDFVEKLKE